MKIAVIGLGYVGLPLSLQFARSCVSVLGLDAGPKKVELLNNGQSYIKHIQSAEIAELVDVGKFYASTDFGQIKEVEAVIICVPTPLNKNREPDLSYVLQTGRSIAPHLQQGTLVVLESTTYPGTTEEDLRVILEENSSLNSQFAEAPDARGHQLSPGFLAGTRGPREQSEQSQRGPEGCGRLYRGPASSARWKSMAKPLTHRFRCRRAALLKQPSYLRIFFAA